MLKNLYPITGCARLSPKFATITAEAPELALAQPGQFAHILCGGGINSCMRRPLCISDVCNDHVRLLFQIKGEGTAYLAGRALGDTLDIIGPLGKGYELPTTGTVALIAGGIGIAPLIYLARQARQANLKVFLFYGAAQREDILATDALAAMGVGITIATVDGSLGYHGLVSEAVAEYLAAEKPAALYSCGPRAMQKTLADLATSHDVPLQVSLEERMACGVGACRGCVVLIKGANGSSYKNVCSEGPVFDAKEVDFDA